MKICFECDAPAEHEHHVIPRSFGGTRTIPLCEVCHGKVHGKDMRISALTRRGLAAAKARGVRLGAPTLLELAPETVARVRELYATGDYSHRSLAEHLNAEGVPAAKGGRWWAKTVRAALMGQAADQVPASPR